MPNDSYDRIMNILTSDNPMAGIENEIDLFPFIESEMKGVMHAHKHAEGDVWEHTKLAIRHMQEQPGHDWLDILIALVHDIGKKEALEINYGKNMAGHDMLGVPTFERWQREFMPDMEKELVEEVDYCIYMHMKAHALADTRSSFDIMEFVTDPRFPRIARLARVDSMSCLDENGNPVADFEVNVMENPRVKRWLGQPPEAPVVGRHDLEAAGIKHEQLHAFCIRYCLKQQVNGKLTNRRSLIRSLLNDEGFKRLQLQLEA